MATFEQNIRKIRGGAIYGPEMRTAIADAIEQSLGVDIDGSDGTVYFLLTPIEGTFSDYLLTIRNGETT